MTDPIVARIEVRDRTIAAREHRVARSARQNLRVPVFAAETIDLFWLKAETGVALPVEKLDVWAKRVFSDPILQNYSLAKKEEFQPPAGLNLKPSYVAEVRFLPGVTDNVGKSATEALSLLDGFARENKVRVFSGKNIYFYGDLARGEVERAALELVGNPLIEEIKVKTWQEFQTEDRFSGQTVPEVKLAGEITVEEISLDGDDRALEKMSKERCWALTAAELNTIRGYFAREDVTLRRKAEGLPANPTDVEMEILAQTWSEHCKHKIFAAEIDYTESNDVAGPVEFYPRLGAFTVKSIFKSYIRKATEDVKAKRGLDWLVSVFTDNAGVVRFDKNIDLCIKVETHNSPSALDPYGGALTGIVGVNRDILGCGMGARPIANTDVFCFASPEWPAAGDDKELPPGLKHPRRIFEGVHLGVEDGGNKSGIPTVNGAIVFHRNYSGKPLVFCGTIGALPQKLPNGVDAAGKGQKPGDLVVMAGGRIGMDGIHGATFSSMELSDNAPATAVQIGDPITQKRLADFLLEARDLGLFSSVTDNGAGGLSSSVGEMASLTGGATIDVSLPPLKYPGLKPFEVVVSESQERMTFSVPKEKWEAFSGLAKKRGVEVCALGEFASDGFFRVKYGERVVGCLDLNFLHDGLPAMILKAEWQGPKEDVVYGRPEIREPIEEAELSARSFYERALFRLLARWNIRSKESWVRRYDHEVQAATVVKPFVGVEQDGPSDAGVLWLAPHGGEEQAGVAVSCGLQPKLSSFDAYLSAQHALDEAVRNAVAVGADPDQIAVIDNFCWPDPLVSDRNPDAIHKLAQLVRANRGLYDLALAYGTPFVSGKDSMKNDFVGKSRFGKDVKISIPPTVLVTALAKVPDVTKTVTSDFKAVGDKIFLLGKNYRNLGGSELLGEFDLPGNAISPTPPVVRAEEQLSLYRKLFQAIQAGLVRSCHDCSEGGFLVALAESSLGGNLGLRADTAEFADVLKEFGGSFAEFLFHETPGRFVVSVSPENGEKFKAVLAGESVVPFGEITGDQVLRVTRHGLVLIDAPVAKIRSAWKGEGL